MDKRLFGVTRNGEDVYIYTISDGNLSADIMTRGATLVRLIHDGTDIIGGYDSVADYEADTSYQGATVGRVANRISGAAFNIDGKIFHVDANENGNCLHGGYSGLSSKIWDVVKYDGKSICLSCFSPDGECGFPGSLSVRVAFSVKDGYLAIDYAAVPDKKTPVSMTNHSYFNLNGLGGDVLRHRVQIFSDEVTEVDKALLPTGKRLQVAGTVFDLRSPREVGESLSDDFDGYDNNYMLSGDEKKSFEVVSASGDCLKEMRTLAAAAVVTAEKRRMEVYTDAEGIQLYTANAMSGKPNFKGGIKRIPHGALCLEAQLEPDSVNRGRGLIGAGETYRQTTVYSFSRIPS